MVSMVWLGIGLIAAKFFGDWLFGELE